MQNVSLLKEVGRVNRPVMLKRGLMSSIDERLMERICDLTRAAAPPTGASQTR